MRIPFYNLPNTRKLEYAIFTTILLFIFKIVFPVADAVLLIVANESLTFLSIYFWFLYLIKTVTIKSKFPLSIILNAGILNALLFSIIAVASSVFSSSEDISSRSSFGYVIVSSILAYLFIGSLTYILSVFRELLYLRQKKDPRAYFNTMFLFITLAFFATLLERLDTSFDYLTNTFFVVSIVLISVNSLRVAWIAFLSKKQKLYLLFISIVLSMLFGVNFFFSYESYFIAELISGFSVGLKMFYQLMMIYGTIYFGVIFFTTLFHLPTAEAFDRKADEVSSFMDMSKLMTQVFDFKELADTITRTTNRVCSSQSAWLVTKMNEKFELSSVYNIGYVEADKLAQKIIEEYEDQLTSVLTLNHRKIKITIQNDVRYVNFNSIAIAPLSTHNTISGYLFVARNEDISFDEEDQKAVGAFADYASVALENAKHIEESIEKERMEKELDVAREVQNKIVPSCSPYFENLDISFLFIPAFEVGGDYYDFFELGNNKLGFVIADVSGKGISASFVMAEVKGIFESLSKLILSPKELLIKANDILSKSLDKKVFVTAIYGVIDIDKGTLNFARAGHPPVIHLTNGGTESLKPDGLGLGIDSGSIFSNSLKEMEIQLNNDDIIVLFTDGIPESQNSKLEEFGYDRLNRIVSSNSYKGIGELSNKIMKEISLFTKDYSQHDDITMVIFKWNFKNNNSGVN